MLDAILYSPPRFPQIRSLANIAQNSRPVASKCLPPDAACQYAPKAVAAILNVVPAALYNVISLLLVAVPLLGNNGREDR